MYSLLLFAHSWLRWIVLLTGLWAFAHALMGARGSRGWTQADARPGLFFISSVDLQFLIGLALYLVFSPTVQAAVQNISGAMRNPELRFFLVEHQIGMIIALVLAHIGRSRSKKAKTDAARFKSAALFYGLSLVIMLLSIPWPGMPAARTLFRGL